MKSKWKLEENTISSLILDNVSYEEIGRRYGCSGSNIKKVANRLGIELKQRRKINKNETFNKGCARIQKKIGHCLNCGSDFKILDGYSKRYCCNRCKVEYLHKEGYQKILDGDPSIMRANYNPKTFKKDILMEQNCVCAICGLKPEWNGKPLVFILDHIDGHASNNKRDNLRCICPNCDSQLDTYKSKNKCGERSYYRYHRMNDIIEK